MKTTTRLSRERFISNYYIKTMSIYDNETKIYPDLKPSASQEPQAYRSKKLTEIEAYLLDETEVR